MKTGSGLTMKAIIGVIVVALVVSGGMSALVAFAAAEVVDSSSSVQQQKFAITNIVSLEHLLDDTFLIDGTDPEAITALLPDDYLCEGWVGSSTKAGGVKSYFSGMRCTFPPFLGNSDAIQKEIIKGLIRELNGIPGIIAVPAN